MMRVIERFWDRENLKDISLEENIAFDLFNDLHDRRGILDDVDSEIENEILKEWIYKIRIWVR